MNRTSQDKTGPDLTHVGPPVAAARAIAWHRVAIAVVAHAFGSLAAVLFAGKAVKTTGAANIRGFKRDQPSGEG